MKTPNSPKATCAGCPLSRRRFLSTASAGALGALAAGSLLAGLRDGAEDARPRHLRPPRRRPARARLAQRRLRLPAGHGPDDGPRRPGPARRPGPDVHGQGRGRGQEDRGR
ncbi:MAG: hypothetical protein MZV49_06290 [Rhodopseudomonas palustris]|nr:hypothetical protein [Rhodopseudomonas palustris]